LGKSLGHGDRIISGKVSTKKRETLWEGKRGGRL